MPYQVAAFYQFAALPDFRELREPLRAICARLALKLLELGYPAQKVVDDAVAPVAEAFPALTIRTRVLEGNPSLALVEASRHAALLVVGNRGHAEFTGLLLGSVSQHCAVHAACPVLIYRHQAG